MSCPEWKEQVALLAGGDPVSSDVMAHVAACEKCRQYEVELRAAIDVWRQEPDIPEEVLAQVRRGVLSRVNRRPRVTWWIAAAAAAVVVIALLLPIRRHQELTLAPPAAPAAPVLKPPALKPPETTVAAAPKRVQPVPASMPASKTARRSAGSAGSTVIKLFTDDPDVVILLVDSEGGFE